MVSWVSPEPCQVPDMEHILHAQKRCVCVCVEIKREERNWKWKDEKDVECQSKKWFMAFLENCRDP